jgi:AcrR family transcriptional regulator
MGTEEREDRNGSDVGNGDEEQLDGRSVRAQRQRESRRKEVLKCALSVFSEKGYHDTSITDIIEAAGIARGTFYLYFDNKRAIFEELLDSFMARIAGALRRVSLDEGAPPPVEQIRQSVARVVGVLADNGEFTRLLLRQAVGLDTEFDQRLAEFYGKVLQRIEQALVLGQSMGLVREFDALIVASCILGSIKEVANQFLLQDGGEPPDRELLEQEILDFSLKGVFQWKNP